ncbi:hypothetical protein F5Y19DRAFT_492791 [Xylariaceae sp. FL1651]|nr:hypothetical protein F5Y19DRAFT_492791 [Xylariaceae sp. FL1651]
MEETVIKALLQPGFAFMQKAPFGTELATRFYSAVLGPIENENVEELRARVDKQMKQLFRICLDRRDFYIAVRGSNIFWEVVNEQWDALEFTDPLDVAAFVETYLAARERCDARVPTSDLAHLADSLIEMRRVVLMLAPARHFEINLRPKNSANTRIRQWPPSLYSAREVAWFTPEHIIDQLYGLSWGKILDPKEIPKIPDASMHPLDVHLFLCWTALTWYRSTRRISALFMVPITFQDDSERKDWYKATGGASKLCATISEFGMFAKGEFSSGRQAVIGLCHFVSPASILD